MGPVAASIIGSAVGTAGNIISNNVAFNRQKELNKIKYEDMINYAQKFGATPTSMIQGITGNAGGAVPTVSTSNNPVSDFGQTFSSSVSAAAAQRQAGAAEQQSQAALTNAETERQLALMKLKFEPQKYFADIRKSLAEAFESTKHAFLHGSMKSYYDELTKDVMQVRPWKIAGLRQSLLNDMATYNKIIQDTATSKAQEGYFKAGAYELQTRGEFNKAETYRSWNETQNEALRGYRLQWENTLLSYGIDINKSFWENTGRLMFTNPRLFKDRMNMFVSSLNVLDSRIQENLGDHYKRNIMLGVGAYQFNKLHQKNADSRSYRFNNGIQAISRLVPFLNLGSSVPSVGVSGPGVDWWLKD